MAIVVINKILTTVAIAGITWIGYDTHSEKDSKITNGVFAAQFFNTAILLLLVNANLSEVTPMIGWIFNGPFNDFIPLWYRVVGYTVT